MKHLYLLTIFLIACIDAPEDTRISEGQALSDTSTLSPVDSGQYTLTSEPLTRDDITMMLDSVLILAERVTYEAEKFMIEQEQLNIRLIDSLEELNE